MEVDNARVPDAGDAINKKKACFRAEIDTSVAFESVKEAVSRFGGVGYWKPTHSTLSVVQRASEEADAAKLEEQTDVLHKELILKERETLDVLKELESTKRRVEGLRVRLQKEESEVKNLTLETTSVCDQAMMNGEEKVDKENQGSHFFPSSSSSPGSILMELKQAKMNLSRTTTDLADVQASVDSLNKKLEKERISLEKTRERLTHNSSKISSLEDEVNHMRLRLQVTKDAEEDPLDVTRELERLSSEAENFKKMGEVAKAEVLRTMSEIEQTKTMIRTAEIRLVAARKMKEAARAAEVMALAEISALSNGDSMQKQDGVTLSFEEYHDLTKKAQEAEEKSKKRVVDAMLRVDEANVLKMDILKRVEEAAEEVKTSKKVMEEALERVEAANRGKLAVEEALRKWRADSNKRRSSIQNSTKFKNAYPSHRRDSRLLDVNGLNLVNDEIKTVLKPTLSIGQILSRKLLLPGEEYEAGGVVEGRSSVKRKVSLGQMLGRQNGDPEFNNSNGKVDKEESVQKQSSAKRKFGFARFSLLLAKQQKRKKKPTMNLR